VKKQTLHILQVYRGLAVLFVVFYHAILIIFNNDEFYSFWELLSWGYSGVHIFFVLSGFIICFIHFSDINKPSRAGKYLYKRFTRIYPVYWVVLLIFIPAYLSSINSINIYHIFENITLLRVSNHDKIIAVAWTLSHEVLFYAIFFVLILNRTVGSIVICFWTLLIIYYLATGSVFMPPL
jgi:peptidoglycan/LPS O-acetylase OafA/YrhL